MASSIALVFSVCLVLNMVMPTLAATHTVGDTSGWAIGGDYSTWASGLKFRVGDSLGKKSSSFMHNTKYHNHHLNFFTRYLSNSRKKNVVLHHFPTI